MPESKVRKQAAKKKVLKQEAELAERKAEARAKQNVLDGTRDWVPYVFVPMGLLGVLWLIIFYVAGAQIPLFRTLGNWNYAIGLGLIAGCFGVATLWK